MSKASAKVRGPGNPKELPAEVRELILTARQTVVLSKELGRAHFVE